MYSLLDLEVNAALLCLLLLVYADALPQVEGDIVKY
jgi:hypothetical protein